MQDSTSRICDICKKSIDLIKAQSKSFYFFNVTEKSLSCFYLKLFNNYDIFSLFFKYIMYKIDTIYVNSYEDW